MTLWLLRPIDRRAGPWDPWHDKMFGFVIRAETEAEARALATQRSGDETMDAEGERTVPAWTDAALSRCVELTADGPAGIVIEDFQGA